MRRNQREIRDRFFSFCCCYCCCFEIFFFRTPADRKKNNRRKKQNVYGWYISIVWVKWMEIKKKIFACCREQQYTLYHNFLKTFWRFLFHVMPFSGCYFLPPWHGKKENERMVKKKFYHDMSQIVGKAY